MARTIPSVPAEQKQMSNGVPPVTVPKLPRQPRQRRRGLLLLGLIVVAGGGVLAYHTVSRMSDRTSAVVMARDVAIGQQITESDVTTTMVGTDEMVATVPGRELGRVVGMRAAVDLMAGTLVQPKAVTDRLSPAGEQRLVPVAVKPSRLPARGFRPGDPVIVLPTPEGQAQTEAKEEITAVVDQVKGPDTDGLVVIDLIVDGADASKLAELAADGRIALVLTPRRP
ncbi:SAF domain-containing protein [Streptosporangium sp. NPDC051022]|uniref:SAF domain-containing protein n=1 Tax=Streptosporangium sp. NPDC051022 TaxID=3155752 RepID=UPI00341F426D